MAYPDCGQAQDSENVSASAGTRGDVLVRNAGLNLVASLAPAAVGALAIPMVIHRLGAERFGILSLAWAILWLAAYCDLGMSRATTKFVAEALGRGDRGRIANLFWISSGIQAVFGTLAAAAIALATPFLTRRVLNIPLPLAGETRLAFYLTGACIPFLLLANNFQGVLAAAQRFDLIVLVKTPFNASLFALPAVGVMLGYNIRGIMWLLFLSRVAAALVYERVCRGALQIQGPAPWNRAVAIELFHFGRWVAVSNVLVPLLVYSDRFIIGPLATAAAVGYYTLSYETVARLLIIPAGLGGVLFPAFSSVPKGNVHRLKELYVRSLKSVLLIMAPLVLVLIVFSNDLLRRWVGPDFAAKSDVALKILAVGMLLNALSQMPINLLDGIGRPDVRTKLFAAYLLPYIGLVWFLVGRMGIVGAALAWSLRAMLELVLFCGLAGRVLRFPSAAPVERGLTRACVACGCLAGFVVFLRTQIAGETFLRPLAAVAGLSIFAALSWRFVLDAVDRRSVLAVMGIQGRV